jgi:hypothetical protein
MVPRWLVVAVVIARGGTASANQPWITDERDRAEHWSWAPLVSALYASDTAAEDQTSGILGAQLRVRYGKALAGNSLHHEQPLRLWSFGIGVETVRFESFEPALLVGRHWLPVESYWWGGPFFLDLRLDVGVGYAWADAKDQPFAIVKTGAGVLLTRENKKIRGDHSFHVLRLRQQLDFVIEAQVARDGEWRLGFGIELDLLRFVADAFHAGEFL